VLALVLGAGWPATLLTGGAELLRGAFILAAVLVLLAGLGARDGRAAEEAARAHVSDALELVLAKVG
jgi:hypothetical protein